MRILVLGSPESRYCQELQRAAVRQGDECYLLSPEMISSSLSRGGEHFVSRNGEDPTRQKFDFPLEEFDACIIRAMPAGSLEQVIFRMDLLWSLEQAGVRMINAPKGMECAIDKYLTLSRCRLAGLPVPETFCCESAEAALEQFENWEQNAVVKPLFGAEGRGIVHLTDSETARRVFRALEQIGAVIYLQRFVQHGGSDLRVLMLDGEPLGAIRRTSLEDFRTNCSLSGVASPHLLSEEEKQLARKACQATGVVFAGVDLISNQEDEMFVLEVNGCPGWQAFQKVTGIDVPGRLLDWLAKSHDRKR